MDDYRRLNALTLLRCAVYSFAGALSLAQADRTIPFEVPASGSKTGTYGYTATAANNSIYQAYGKWDTQSRFVNPKASPIGAGASGFGGASYGFRGTVSVSSSIFKQLLILEGGLLALDWIKSQYQLAENQTITPDGYVETSKKAINYVCDTSECYWSVDDAQCSNYRIPQSTYFAGMSAAMQCTQEKLSNSGYGACSHVETFFFDKTSGRYLAEGCYNPNPGPQGAASTYFYLHGDTNKATSIGEQEFYTKTPLPEPSINPDPYYTAAILDRFAGQLPALRNAVSDNVEFLASPFRFTRKDANGAILEDWEGVLEPTDYPVINPYKTAVPQELPRIEPTPQLKTKNLLNGEEITTTTDPVTQTPTGDPAVRDKVDLSKLEAYTAGINAATNALNNKIPEFANQELEYTPDDSEIPVNEDLTAEETATAIARLFVPTVTNPNTLLDTFIPLAHNFETQQILSDSSDTCPAPITLATIGGQQVQMSFDSICEFLRLIKKMILPAIGFFMALSWIKRISAAGG